MSESNVQHCPWCDGEGRCGGIDVGCTGVKGATHHDAIDLYRKRHGNDMHHDMLCTIERLVCDLATANAARATAFANARSWQEYGEAAERDLMASDEALAACQAQAAGRIRVLEEALQGLLDLHDDDVFAYWGNDEPSIEARLDAAYVALFP